MSWRGVFSGALALIALQAVVSNTSSASRVGELLSSVGDLVRAALSPNIPAIPNMSTTSSTTL